VGKTILSVPDTRLTDIVSDSLALAFPFQSKIISCRYAERTQEFSTNPGPVYS
jgi:hypothetical protein